MLKGRHSVSVYGSRVEGGVMIECVGGLEGWRESRVGIYDMSG